MTQPELEQATQLVIQAVAERLGTQDPAVVELVAREVVAAMSGSHKVPPPSTPRPPQPGAAALDNGDGTVTTPLGARVPLPRDGEALELCSQCLEQLRRQSQQRAIVTTTGHNTKGVVARISAQIAECGGDIQDISQTIVAGYFTMILVVDISQLSHPFSEFKTRLLGVAQEMGIHAAIMHEDVTRALQRV